MDLGRGMIVILINLKHPSIFAKEIFVRVRPCLKKYLFIALFVKHGIAKIVDKSILFQVFMRLYALAVEKGTKAIVNRQISRKKTQ